MQDVPDIDGLVYIKNETEKDILHKYVNVQITEVYNYDMIAELK